MNDEEWDDYIRGNATGYSLGSAYGQAGANNYNERQKYYDKSIQNFPEVSQEQSGASMEESYLFVDRFFDLLPDWFGKFLVVLGGFAGLIAGLQSSFETVGVVFSSIAGGFIGAILIPVIIFFLKFIISIIILGVALGVIYIVFQYLL